jgi:uncharacterized protein (DUF952 family)
LCYRITVATTVILHITERSHWERAQVVGEYRTDSLETQGFIHCSTPEQVARVANALFRDQSDLVLLVIEPARVAAEIRYGTPEGGKEPFPHIYGPLNLNAVVRVLPFEPNVGGRFTSPTESTKEEGRGADDVQ